jgi:hypothetical protein
VGLHLSDILGDCYNSYTFDASSHTKVHNGRCKRWGPTRDETGGEVVGVAIDMIQGKIKYGVDCCWAHTLGVAFKGMKKNISYYPALTGWSGARVSVNFGDVDFKYGPREATFEELAGVH